MLHAPTLSYNRQTEEITVVPLNDIPKAEVDWMDTIAIGTNPAWIDYLGSDCGLGHLLNDSETLEKIYKCNGILPLTRKPMSDYAGPTREDGTPARLFEIMNDPIMVQPTLVLIAWLHHRGIPVKDNVPRNAIEDLV